MGQRMLANMTAHGGFDITLAWDPNADACLALEQQYPGLNRPGFAGGSKP
jgi:hypothetical protein